LLSIQETVFLQVDTQSKSFKQHRIVDLRSSWGISKHHRILEDSDRG